MYAKVVEVILAPSNAYKTGMEEGKGLGDDESNPRDAYVLKEGFGLVRFPFKGVVYRDSLI
jgi:hypothetical protein